MPPRGLNSKTLKNLRNFDKVRIGWLAELAELPGWPRRVILPKMPRAPVVGFSRFSRNLMLKAGGGWLACGTAPRREGVEGDVFFTGKTDVFEKVFITHCKNGVF